MASNNDQTIYNQVTADGIPPTLATLIVAQARHESNNYTSDVFLTCGNAFGYKWVGQSTADGPCSGSPEGDPYAYYANGPAQSAHEIAMWIHRRQLAGQFPADLTTITTPDQYAQLLKSAGYYGDTVSNYANGLVYWLQQIGTLQPAATGGILLLLIALGFIAYRKKIFKK